jgi:hypothetical protein
VLETHARGCDVQQPLRLLRESAIAARVVAMEVRVDDVLDRLAARQLVDLGL